jgi:hypothetical protein
VKANRTLSTLVLLAVVGAVAYAAALVRRGFRGQATPSAIETLLAKSARKLTVPANYRQLHNPFPVRKATSKPGWSTSQITARPATRTMVAATRCFSSREFTSPARQGVTGFFVTASSLKLLSSKTVARFGSSAPLISNSQFWPTFFTLPREL